MKKSFFHSIYFREYKEEMKTSDSLPPYTIKSIEYAKRDGFQGIELIPFGEFMAPNGYDFADDFKDKAKRIREKLDIEGITCPCFSNGVSILGNLDYARRVVKDTIDFAEIVGAPYVHHTFQQVSLPENVSPIFNVYQKAEDAFVEFSKEMAEYAGEKGIDCIYEDQGFYVNTVDRLGSILAKVDMPNTGVCLDVGNTFFYDTLPEHYAGAFAKLIKHVHIKDYVRSDSPVMPLPGWHRTISGSYLQECLVGTGIVNFEKVFETLIRSHYDGYFSLENQSAVRNLNLEAELSDIKQAMNNVEFIYNRVSDKINKNECK